MSKRNPPIPKTAAELAPAPYNPRKLSEQAGRALGYSMSEFGDLSGFVFNLRTAHLVSGHQRKEQLDPGSKIVNYTEAPDECGTVGLGHIQQGNRLWPIRFVDWDELKEKAGNLAANNPEIAGEFTEGVVELMNEIAAAMPDVYDQALLFKIQDELRGDKGKTDEDEDGAEHDLSPAPYESYDYVVLIFKNAIDWTAAAEHFKLKQLRDPSGGKGAVGLGCVVDGAEYLARVGKSK
jgi:hypothetical protein